MRNENFTSVVFVAIVWVTLTLLFVSEAYRRVQTTPNAMEVQHKRLEDLFRGHN